MAIDQVDMRAILADVQVHERLQRVFLFQADASADKPEVFAVGAENRVGDEHDQIACQGLECVADHRFSPGQRGTTLQRLSVQLQAAGGRSDDLSLCVGYQYRIEAVVLVQQAVCLVVQSSSVCEGMADECGCKPQAIQFGTQHFLHTGCDPGSVSLVGLQGVFRQLGSLGGEHHPESIGQGCDSTDQRERQQQRAQGELGAWPCRHVAHPDAEGMRFGEAASPWGWKRAPCAFWRILIGLLQQNAESSDQVSHICFRATILTWFRRRIAFRRSATDNH
ncbi:hypothetical protein WR25_03389 [Diploscapter pachys]|uniref:Uncharacterized protein n=1 Tax=Diploscapter pachys TaxID=2018661 RepID=A0A2A2M2R6_9BILA|nr:hypothetical protein WR25_03389 [Diploscapter pachys]